MYVIVYVHTSPDSCVDLVCTEMKDSLQEALIFCQELYRSNEDLISLTKVW